MERELLTTRQIADLLQVSVETVRDWSRRGLIPVIRLHGPVRRYDREAVLASLRNRQSETGGVQ